MPGIRTRRFALTLTDLIFAMSAILVVTLVVGPALTRPRATARLTDCLSNLQRIGLALHAYAAEDPREQAIPLQMDMVSNPAYLGPTVADNGFWLWRTANWFAWGGQSATQVFKVSSSAGYALSDTPPQDANSIAYVQRPDYAASHRPLNGYITPDPLDVFHCAADTGYPNSPIIDDSPAANAGRPCWNTLGNSYRASLAAYVWLSGSTPSAVFSVGAWGHRLSTLPNQSRYILLGDPPWFNMVGYDPNSQANPAPVGWHGVEWSDNLLFCDGSARLTSTLGRVQGPGRRPLSADALKLDQPPLCGNVGGLYSGPTWQLDCYPTPGAVIFGYAFLSSWLASQGDCWPTRHAYMNPLRDAPGDAPAPPQPSTVQVLW